MDETWFTNNYDAKEVLMEMDHDDAIYDIYGIGIMLNSIQWADNNFSVLLI